MLLDALAASDLRTEEFEVASCDAPAPVYDLMNPTKTLKNAALVFTHLRRLKLWVWAEASASLPNRQRLRDLFPFLPKLEELELWFEVCCMLGPYQLGSPFLQKRFPALKSLVLFNWDFKYAELLRFLKMQTNSKRVRFDSCRFKHANIQKSMKQIPVDKVRQKLAAECNVGEITIKEGSAGWGCKLRTKSEGNSDLDDSDPADDSDGADA